MDLFALPFFEGAGAEGSTESAGPTLWHLGMTTKNGFLHVLLKKWPFFIWDNTILYSVIYVLYTYISVYVQIYWYLLYLVDNAFPEKLRLQGPDWCSSAKVWSGLTYGLIWKVLLVYKLHSTRLLVYHGLSWYIQTLLWGKSTVAFMLLVILGCLKMFFFLVKV